MKNSLLQLKTAICLVLLSLTATAQTTLISGPVGSGAFGKPIKVLTNGNYVVVDSLYDEGAVTNVGAVYLYNGITHTLISTLKGSTAEDQVGGNGGVTALSNGNFVVTSTLWDNGPATDAGAVTWVNGITGLNDVVSNSNSLVGSTSDDKVGNKGVNNLDNGHYVVISNLWNNGATNDAGAVTWCNGTTGLTGVLNSANSLVGGSASDRVGEDGIFVLQDGNYIVLSSFWNNTSPAASAAGAVTWCNGTTGRTGLISSANSLVGSLNNNRVGFAAVNQKAIIPLPNGKYVVRSTSWDIPGVLNVGAVTLCNADGSTIGAVSSSNSLVGSTASDNVGSGGVQVLPNGNYVVISSVWNNTSPAATDAGAVTWCDATVGKTGAISNSNSLVGTTSLDRIGNDGITILSNGNYVVASQYWGPSTNSYGAVTWCDGATGTIGNVSGSNSLVGSTDLDNVGSGGIVALTNGNYVVKSPGWNNLSPVTLAAGAVTWCSGTIPLTGTVSSSNSLVGTLANDRLGDNGVTALTNGNYVVRFYTWDNGAATNVGAATWCDGTTGRVGNVDASNSLVGTVTGDQVGDFGIVALANGNYVVASSMWDNGVTASTGAVTWCNGTTGRTGTLSSANSLVGTSSGDLIGNGFVFPLPNGNYVVVSYTWNNGGAAQAGAVTWGNGSTGTIGNVSSSNSLVGSTANDNIGRDGITILPNGNYLVRSYRWDNGAAQDAGAITWGNGNTGISGIVGPANSLVGSSANNEVGLQSNPLEVLPNSNFIISSPNWDNGANADVGAKTWGNGGTGVKGVITDCNSVTGNEIFAGSTLVHAYNSVHGYFIVGKPWENGIAVFYPDGMAMANSSDATTEFVTGTTPVPFIVNPGCRIIATLTPSGASPVSGNTDAKAWIESSVQTYLSRPYVARHHEITPQTGASSSTGRVTLYFTQQEFTDFNDHPGSTLNLPVNPTDNSGKANLYILKFAGTSNNGSGLPSSYTSGASLINPNDAAITWNSFLNRWEVSFDVTGFSGFIVVTDQTILPLTLINFDATVYADDVITSWKTTNEINTAGFEIERSINGYDFLKVGHKPAVNSPGEQLYNYTDKMAAMQFAVNGKLFYRLKIIDIDGRSRYSQVAVVYLNSGKNGFLAGVQPIPFTTYFNVNLNMNTAGTILVQLTDINGRIVNHTRLNASKGLSTHSITGLAHLPPGMYLLRLKSETEIVTQKLIKQ